VSESSAERVAREIAEKYSHEFTEVFHQSAVFERKLTELFLSAINEGVARAIEESRQQQKIIQRGNPPFILSDDCEDGGSNG